jgi:predicted aldo/keto reductase-like oxidoreductase
LKNEGRIRFLGVSHHGSNWHRAPEETMQKVLLTAAADGRFDVFLLAYNFLQMDMGKEVLKACREKNIGTTLMKVNPVGNYYGIKAWVESRQKEGKEVPELYQEGLERFRKKAEQAEGFIKRHNLTNPDEISSAAIKFVLGNPDVHTVCCSMRNFDTLNKYLKLSGQKMLPAEKKALALYKEGCGMLYCRHACGECESHCPHGVPINTILRYNHYFEAQGREKYAMKLYSALPVTNARVCENCSGMCEKACPYNVPTQGMLTAAHQRLTLV